MTCVRCGGFLVQQHYEDLWDETASFRFLGWRCGRCGDVVGPAIASHRSVRRARTGGRMTPTTVAPVAT